jgi:hypothetical protein
LYQAIVCGKWERDGQHAAAGVGKNNLRFARAIREKELIVLSTLNTLNRARRTSTRAPRLAGNQYVIKAVTDDGLRAAGEIGDNRRKALSIQPVGLNVNKLLVQM